MSTEREFYCCDDFRLTEVGERGGLIIGTRDGSQAVRLNPSSLCQLHNAITEYFDSRSRELSDAESIEAEVDRSFREFAEIVLDRERRLGWTMDGSSSAQQ